jgi:hypothetical protein
VQGAVHTVTYIVCPGGTQNTVNVPYEGNMVTICTTAQGIISDNGQAVVAQTYPTGYPCSGDTTTTTTTTTTETPVTNYRFTLCDGEGIPTVTVGLNGLIAGGMPSNIVPTVGDSITISGSGNLTGCYEYVETVSTGLTGPAPLSWNECSCGTPL